NEILRNRSHRNFLQCGQVGARTKIGAGTSKNRDSNRGIIVLPAQRALQRCDQFVVQRIALVRTIEGKARNAVAGLRNQNFISAHSQSSVRAANPNSAASLSETSICIRSSAVEKVFP